MKPKRLLSLLLLACLLLSACAYPPGYEPGKEVESAIGEKGAKEAPDRSGAPADEETNRDGACMEMEVLRLECTAQPFPVTVLHSAEECGAFLEALPGSFTEQEKIYGDGFFTKYVLAAVYLEESSGGNTFSFAGSETEEDRVTLTVTRHPYGMTCDMAYYCLLFALDRKAVGDAPSVSLRCQTELAGEWIDSGLLQSKQSPLLISTYAEWKKFLSGNPDHSKWAGEYPDEFFRTGAIAVLSFTEPSGSIRYKGESALLTEDGTLRLSMTRLLPPEGADMTCDLGMYTFLFVFSGTEYVSAREGGGVKLSLSVTDCVAGDPVPAGTEAETEGPIPAQTAIPETVGETGVPVEPVSVEEGNPFWERLLWAVYDEARGQNVLLSPLSLETALTMLEPGAAGNTLTQIRNALGRSTKDQTARISALMHKDAGQLALYNSLWARDDVSLRNDFREVNEKELLASLLPLTGAEPVNAWINEKTKGRIPKMLDRLSSDTALLLVNALTFDAEWDDPFDEVRAQGFTGADGTKYDALFVRGRAAAVRLSSASGFIKPYRDGEYGFLALLPNEAGDKGIMTVLQELASVSIPTLPLRTTVRAVIPQFKTEYGDSMVHPLKMLGITDAFDSARADFSPIGDPALFVSDVLHKTSLTFGRDGTVAAAATVIEIKNGIPAPEDIVVFNRPFVYLIVGARGEVIFAGILNQL